LDPLPGAEAGQRANSVNNAGSQSAHKTKWIADGDDELADAQLARIAQRCGGQIGHGEPQNCEIAKRITRGDLGWK
jgi:hypothetical protein